MQHMTIKRILDICMITTSSKLQSKLGKSSNSVGCYCPRRIAVLKQLKNFEKWKHSVSYGHRWAAELVFSSIKRMLGEYMYIQGSFQTW
jgi:hypothetical protein